MEISVFGMTDVGSRREKNEDAYLINTEHNLYIVADGMGGHLGGEIASRLAVSTIEEVIKGVLHDPEMTLQADLEIRPGDYRGYLQYAIGVASSRIFYRASNDPSLHGMGTTVVAMMFNGGKAYIGHVGDSRCYVVRGGRIRQLTQDHSLVGEQLRAGVISASDVKNHKLKNIITRSVGFQEDVDVDIIVRPIKKGDKFVICSDGLTNMVTTDALLEVVGEKCPREACMELIERANLNGGDDNITVIITEVVSSEPAEVKDEETEGI